MKSFTIYEMRSNEKLVKDKIQKDQPIDFYFQNLAPVLDWHWETPPNFFSG